MPPVVDKSVPLFTGADNRVARWHGVFWRALRHAQRAGARVVFLRLRLAVNAPQTYSHMVTIDSEFKRAADAWLDAVRMRARRQGSQLAYALVLARADNGLPHAHVLLINPPELPPENTLDIDAQEVGKLDQDAKRITRYMAKQQLLSSVSQARRRSQAFYALANPELRLFLDSEQQERWLSGNTRCCPVCGRVLPLSQAFFRRSGSKSGGYRARCKECQLFETAAQDANARAALAGVPGRLTAHELQELWHAQQGRCYYTQEQLSTRTRSLDHIQPLASGGSNALDNVCWTARRTNARKARKHEREYVAVLCKSGIPSPLRAAHGLPLQLRLFDQEKTA